MKQPETRRFQLTIRRAMTAIAICAVCLWSPKLLVFVSALVFWWILILGLIYTPAVRRLAEWMSLAVIFLVLYALCQPAVQSICGRGLSALPNNAMQRTRLPVGR